MVSSIRSSLKSFSILLRTTLPKKQRSLRLH